MLYRQKTPERAVLISILILTSSIIPVHSTETEVRAERSGDALIVSMSLPRHLRPDIIGPLNSGLRSEISFEIKIYRETSGLRSIFGDRLIREEHINYEGKRDNFSNTYQLSSDSEIRRFAEAEVFLSHYYSLSDYSIPFNPAPEGEYYMMSRIIVDETKLVPPLNILTPFLTGNRTATAWYRQKINTSGGNGT